MSLAFLLTCLLVVATPGTGALFTIAAGISRGARASLIAAVGCTLGTLPHLAAAVTGTAALLRASGFAFEIVKVAGVAYLLYLAWATWRDTGALAVDEEAAPTSARRVIRSAVLINLLNPKLTLFFFAFLPQFVPSDGSALLPMLGLSAVFMTLTLAVFACYGVFAAAVRQQLLTRPRVLVGLRRVFAASFVGLSAKLATTSGS